MDREPSGDYSATANCGWLLIRMVGGILDLMVGGADGQRMERLKSPDWSEPRKRFANGMASVLYGVIAIMSAELAYEPGIASWYAIAAAALLVGLAMSLTHMFVKLVNDETLRGSRVSLQEAWELLRWSLLVMVFPAFVAAFVLIGQLLGVRPRILADMLLYVSVVTVMILGFTSRFVLDRKPIPALVRGVIWTLLSLVLFVAKQLKP